MGPWGAGATSALPIVGDVFQSALRYRWIDPDLEFEIPRPRRAAPPALPDAVRDFFGAVFGRILRGLQ
jgi:penicillin-binding protein 1A